MKFDEVSKLKDGLENQIKGSSSALNELKLQINQLQFTEKELKY